MKRAFVCDDDKSTLFLITFALTELGWEVHTCTDCNNIIEKTSEIAPSVIIMDYDIPDTGGLTATQILKKDAALKHIPVIFFTSHADIAALAKEAGAEFYIAKPFDIRKLKEVMVKAYELSKQGS